LMDTNHIWNQRLIPSAQAPVEFIQLSLPWRLEECIFY